VGPQLIAYADRLGGDLAGLRGLLEGPLARAFAGVHVLPFFTPIDGSDAGFDPVDHLAVDPRLGGWDDIAALGAQRTVMADLIVNHVSTRSAAFADWVAHGETSPHAGMFLTAGSVFGGEPSQAALDLVVRPRPGRPFTAVTLADGTTHQLWTTFTPEQADIDVHHPRGRAHLLDILDTFAAHGVTEVRLDAVGYAVKTPGTSCFLTPETYAFVDELAGWCAERGLLVLVEVHAYWQDQVAIAARVDRAYDFALPPLVLHALHTGDAGPLVRWIDIRPTNVVTVLDTHDGIGVRDVARHGDRPGLLDDDQVHQLVEAIHEATGGISRRATGAAASNVDLYQVNATFLGALGGDHDALYAARVVQVFLPGTPQVYYVGLLHEGDDADLLAETGVGRDVNRHRFTPGEVVTALARPTVQRLLDLLALRRDHPAFDGAATRHDAGPHALDLRWAADDRAVRALVDLAGPTVTVWVDGEVVPALGAG
jgi:sucrose phosphorylase